MTKRRLAALLGSLVVAVVTVSPAGKAAATDTVTYSWSDPTWVVTWELMGETVGDMKFAGVNSGGFIDKAGNLRVIFSSGDGARKKVSVISRDGGATFIVDTAFSFPTGLKEGLGHFSFTTAPEGGFRGFVRDDVGILSVYSPDGQTWTTEPGYRVLVSAVGVAGVDGGAVVKLPNGKYRMYIGDESSYFRVCASSRPVSTVIFSATSSDQLNWTMDPGHRIGPELSPLCKLHPHTFRDSNGEVVVVFHMNNDIPKAVSEWGGSCFFGRSSDGMTFKTIERIPVGLKVRVGPEIYAGDCDVVVMPDKTLRLFFSNSGQIGMSIGTPTVKITCLKGSAKKFVSARNPKCPAGYAKVVSITCLKGSTSKVVSAVKPVCPKGYRKSV